MPLALLAKDVRSEPTAVRKPAEFEALGRIWNPRAGHCGGDRATDCKSTIAGHAEYYLFCGIGTPPVAARRAEPSHRFREQFSAPWRRCADARNGGRIPAEPSR